MTDKQKLDKLKSVAKNMRQAMDIHSIWVRSKKFQLGMICYKAYLLKNVTQSNIRKIIGYFDMIKYDWVI